MAAPDFAAAVLPPLLRVSLEGAALALIVGGICRLRPAPPSAVRAGLWWLVSLKLLVGLLPLPAISVPLVPAEVRAAVDGAFGAGRPAPALGTLPPEALAPVAAPAQGPKPAAAPARPGQVASFTHRERASLAAEIVAPSASAFGGGVRWREAVAALWLCGVLVQALALAWHLVRWRGLMRRARPAPEPLSSLAASIAVRLGLARCPKIRISSETRVPQVGGLVRPVVILPAGAASTLSGDELAMILCHELAHVRRRDLFFGWAPALAERVFFFHPAAWLASREYALAREAACDQMVLDAFDAPPADYGRLLLRLGVGAHDTRLVAAGSSPTFRLLKRRLSMLEYSPSPSRLRSLLALALVTIAACAPVDVVRRPAPARSAPPAPPPAPAADASQAPDAEVDADADDPSPPEAGEGAAQSAPPKPPAKARARRHAEVETHGSGRDRWVITGPRSGNDEMVIMSGSTRDIEVARRAARSSGSSVIYVRRGDKDYVISDPATVAAARKLFASDLELARKQSELGNRQGKLGEEQGALGMKQGELGGRQAMLSAKFAAQEATRAAEEMSREARRMGGSGDARRAEREGERARAEKARAEFEGQERELERQQSQLEREQARLAERQGALAQEQARLAEQQRQASERAERELRGLIDRAIASGVAKPAP